MKKFYFISTIMMILLAVAVSASVNVRYNFMSMTTGQPLSGVDTLVYPCNDAGCYYLGSDALSGSGNSGFNSFSTINYPTDLMTQYGYAAYYLAHGYAPQEYLATWHGTGDTSFTINFNKVANCRAPVIDVAATNNNGEGSHITLSTHIRSAFSDPHNLIGYVLPQYADEFYSSWVEVRYSIFDENNNLVFSDVTHANIYMDNTVSMASSAWTARPGNYTAQVETIVTDDQCSSTLSALNSVRFEVQRTSPQPLNVNLLAEPTSGVEPLDVTFNCSAAGGVGPYTFSFDSDDASGQSQTIAGLNMGRYQMFYVYNYTEGIYHPVCTAVDSEARTDLDSVMINVTELPVQDNAPIVNLISPPNGTVTDQHNITFTFNATDDLTDIMGCSLYINGTARVGAIAHNGTPAAAHINNLADGRYVWNVICSDDSGNIGTAPQDFLLIINSTQPPLPECSDGIDNDGDGHIDFPADPGCVNAADDNETDIIIPPECSDGIDNDGDGYIDFPADPGCVNSVDDNETDIIIPEDPVVTLIEPENGTITNLHDIGFVFNVTDDTSDMLECELRVGTRLSGSVMVYNNMQSAIDMHNLADGRYYWNVLCADEDGNLGTAPEDFLLIINSTYTPECSDGIDNDGDGLVDMNDPGCDSPQDDDETDEVCANHLDISRVRMSGVEIFEGLNYPAFNSDIANGYIPFDYYFANTGDSTIRNINYTTTMRSNVTALNDTSSIVRIVPFSTYVEGQDFTVPPTLANGLYNISVSIEGIDGYGCFQQDDFDFYLLVNRSAPTYECSDGYDNDNDTHIDAADPGCYDSGHYDPFDDDESDTLPECSDFFDNDNDTRIDFPVDPGCVNAADDNETDIITLPECSDGIDNDGDGYIDFPADIGCVNTADDDESNGNSTNDAPIVVLVSPANGTVTNMTDLPFIYRAWDDNAAYLQCTLYTNISGAFQAEQSQFIPNGGYFSVFNEYGIPYGTYVWNVECSDGVLSAFAPDNWTFTIQPQGPTYQCSDGIDNDGDSFIDYPSDPGCVNSTDDNESDHPALPECSDGIDNDGDGLVDLFDPDCQDGQDDDESSGADAGDDEEIVIPDPEEILYMGHIGIYSLTHPDLADELAKPGDELMVSVYLENVAYHDLEDVKLSVSILDLGTFRTVGPFDLEKGEYDTKYVRLDIPEDAAKGPYDIRITAQNSEVTRIKYREVRIV